MITALAEANYGIAKGFLVGPGPVRKEPERPVYRLLSAFSILPVRLAFCHLAHDPEKCAAAFRKHHAQTIS